MWNSLSNISFYENLLEQREAGSIQLIENEVNIEKMCRTCLRDAHDRDNLLKDFEIGAMNINLDGKLLKMIDMLRESTGLQVEESDILPHQICNNCIQNICGAYFFRLQSMKAEKTLFKLIVALSVNDSSGDGNADGNETDEEKYENVQHLDEAMLNGGVGKEERYEIIANNITKNNDVGDEDNGGCGHGDNKEKCELMEIDLIDNSIIITENEEEAEEDMFENESEYVGGEEETEEDRRDLEVHIEYIENGDCTGDDDIAMTSSNRRHAGSGISTVAAVAPVEDKENEEEKLVEEHIINDNDDDDDDDVDNDVETILNKKKIKKLKEYKKCTECTEVFKLKKDLHEHIRVNHPTVKAFECDTCHSKFSKLQTLKRHIKIHQDDQKNKLCTFCGKRFTRADDLKRHIRTHTNERPYVCNLCPKRYKQTSELKEHIITHSREKVYNCGICGKCLLTRNGYYVHMKVHAGVKNHKCNFCDKQYVTSGELNSHIRHIHDKERPYECKFGNCDRKFATKLSFDIHQRAHTGERPFQCSICLKKLATSSSLSDHIKIHTGEKRFYCNLCHKTFNSSTSYKKHLPRHTVINNSSSSSSSSSSSISSNSKGKEKNKRVNNLQECKTNFKNNCKSIDILDDQIVANNKLNETSATNDHNYLENDLQNQELVTIYVHGGGNKQSLSNENITTDCVDNEDDDTARLSNVEILTNNGRQSEDDDNIVNHSTEYRGECQYLVEGDYTDTDDGGHDERHIIETQPNAIQEFLES